jgi:hypothetical protein
MVEACLEGLDQLKLNKDEKIQKLVSIITAKDNEVSP